MEEVYIFANCYNENGRMLYQITYDPTDRFLYAGPPDEEAKDILFCGDNYPRFAQLIRKNPKEFKGTVFCIKPQIDIAFECFGYKYEKA